MSSAQHSAVCLTRYTVHPQAFTGIQKAWCIRTQTHDPGLQIKMMQFSLVELSSTYKEKLRKTGRCDRVLSFIYCC